jgi:CubicO group peptidase (beta-lactamase class C family)
MDWAGRLAELAVEAEVAGAVLGVWADGEETVAPYGVLSTATGVPVTADSVFQIGSISKLWTATLVRQLIDEGRLGLDTTVADVLPGIRLAHREITVRQLLTHTSGIDGDVFTDTGRGDDAVEKYVEQLADGAQVFPPGAAYSYCNSGFVLLGRIVEVLDDRSWDASLRARLIDPLGLGTTMTLPEEAILHRAAVGHEAPDGDGWAEPVTTWGLPRSIGPAGGIVQSAGDLLAFARMYLDGDLAAGMWADQVRLPAGAPSDAVGLAWRVYEWGGRRLVGHDGSTIGQLAFLRVDPAARFAACLLTNSPQAPALFRRIGSEVTRAYLGVELPADPEPADGARPAGLDRHCGRYERAGIRFDVALDGERLRLTATSTGQLAAIIADPVQEYELYPQDDGGDRFVRRERPGQPWFPVSFDRFADGTPYLFSAGRTTAKVSTQG